MTETTIIPRLPRSEAATACGFSDGLCPGREGARGEERIFATWLVSTDDTPPDLSDPELARAAQAAAPLRGNERVEAARAELAASDGDDTSAWSRVEAAMFQPVIQGNRGNPGNHGCDGCQVASVAPVASVSSDREDAPSERSVWSIVNRQYPEPAWVIPGLMPPGLTLLAGKPKLGKSWLALQIAQARAMGSCFLGRQLQRGRVVMFALEDNDRRLADRMSKQGWQPDADTPAWIFTARWFHSEIGCLNRGGAERLVALMDSWDVDLVIVDTFSRAFRGDQNDSCHVLPALSPLQQAALEHNGAILMIDHHGKGFDGLDAVANILGSTAKGATADTLWGLYRQRGRADATLAITGREVDEIEVPIAWHRATCSWRASGSADSVRLTDNRRDILQALAELEPASNQELADALERNKGSVYRDLQELTGGGLVTRDGDDGHRLTNQGRDILGNR